MTATAVDIDAPVDAVFATLADPETYPSWLVGAKRIRRVEPHWPSPGSSFHHAVGVGPLVVRDRTTVLVNEGPVLLALLARVGPLGSARVTFTLTPRTEGGTHLAIEEEPTSGPMRALWNPVTRPLVAVGLWGRNAISLQTLRALAEDRATA